MACVVAELRWVPGGGAEGQGWDLEVSLKGREICKQMICVHPDAYWGGGNNNANNTKSGVLSTLFCQLLCMRGLFLPSISQMRELRGEISLLSRYVAKEWGKRDSNPSESELRATTPP